MVIAHFTTAVQDLAPTEICHNCKCTILVITFAVLLTVGQLATISWYSYNTHSSLVITGEYICIDFNWYQNANESCVSCSGN